jgi:2-(1,2-epoxy-1,2-dihydrophenyl)acetyl-CoA isomerase
LSDYRTIRVSRDGDVATVALSRPDKLNALTPTLLDEVRAAVQSARESGARAVILTGEGRAFCSGADLVPDGLGYTGLPEDLGDLLDSTYNPLVRALADLDIPIITAINGPAVGAGLALALTGDIIVMARSAYLLLAFVNIGLVPDAGATWLVAKAVGRTRALELALLGERMGADEAKAAGLVTRVVDDAALMDEAMAIATRLAAGPTAAFGLIRKQVAAALDSDLEGVLAIERENQTKAGKTADFKESVAAFGEKRKPVFKGH